MMFNKATAPFPFLWTELRKYLVSQNVVLKVHQRHCTIYTVANTIFTDPDENKTALELCHWILSGTIYQNSTDRSHTSGGDGASVRSQDYNEEKTAHNIAMRLKDSESKFSGDLSQCWQDYQDEYEQIAADYNLSMDQRLRYLHNLLSKDAHRFYLDFVKPSARTYHDAISLIDKEYNSVVRQTRVKNHLASLRVDHLIDANTDAAAALAKVYKRILSMCRQVP